MRSTDTESAPALADVYDYVDAHRADFLQQLFTLVRQPSISALDVGVDDCAQLELEVMIDCGLEAELLPTAGKPVVFGRRSSAISPRTVLIYGHYDVQPVDPLEAWVSPPFEPTVREGRVYGRGSGDNKGQHLAQLLAIKSYLSVRGELPLNVKVILEGEEERASPHLAAFVEKHRDLLAADFAYTSDGSLHESGRPMIVYGARGTLQVEVVARGANTDVHSGGRGGLVPNPAWKLVDLLSTMRDRTGRVAIKGFYESVREPTEFEGRAMADLPLDLPAFLAGLGIDRLPPPDGPTFYERLMMLPTLTISGIHGGYGGKGFKTIIPSEARSKLDIRLVPDQDPDEIFSRFCEHIEEYAPDVEVIRHGSIPPSRTRIDSPMSASIIDAIASVYGERPLIVPSHGGTLPDYVFTRTLGIPSFIVPYANPDERQHASNENFEIDRFIKGIKICATVLYNAGHN